VIGVESNSDANRLTHPSEEGQVALFKKLFKTTGIHPEEVNFVSAHATSTQIGDLVEIRSIKKVFGSHVSNIKINAPKSILGHTCWSSAVVELIAAILQANAGKLHPTINVESIDPEVDIDICANNSCDMKVDYFMKNSFGFGGINSASILRKYS
jgi:3-oxoacyl-(acyl-carrier-protein) synthase